MEKMKIQADEDCEKERVDLFVSHIWGDVSRAKIQKMISDGDIKVNGKEVKPKYTVKCSDVIEIDYDPSLDKIEIEPEDIAISVVYEDEHLAVVDKAQGMVVHPGDGNYRGTLVNAILYRMDSLSDINGEIRPGIVHRIDKDTSGLLLIAKTNKAHESLAKQLEEHTVNRRYEALVEGVIKEDKGTIDAPIGRNPSDRKKMAVVEGGKHAVTHFKVVKRYENYTLIEAKLETGRTHQIRVHMQFINHPLVGDPTYGIKKQKFKLNGQLLHAKTLGFIHPATGEYMEFHSELPDYFKDVLRKLK